MLDLISFSPGHLGTFWGRHTSDSHGHSAFPSMQTGEVMLSGLSSVSKTLNETS